MGMVNKLRLLVSSEGELYECRNCGVKFDHNPGECPSCHSREIAHYEF